MVLVTRLRQRTVSAGREPLSPKRKWQTITVGTLLLVPAYWAMLAGLVAASSDDETTGPNSAAALAFGVAFIPFIYIVVAFMSQQSRPPSAVLRAMWLTVLVGVPVSALAGDAVTGIVAGVGAGGIAALRMDAPQNRRSRALAVLAAAVYTMVLVRAAGPIVLVSAPVFPLTAIGLADHLSERKFERRAVGS